MSNGISGRKPSTYGEHNDEWFNVSIVSQLVIVNYWMYITARRAAIIYLVPLLYLPKAIGPIYGTIKEEKK